MINNRSDPGQAALPGGKADSLSETPFETARREAFEEIGLPNIDQKFPSPFWVEHLCELPANLARTELVVRPCVALLHSYNEVTGEDADPEEAFMPQLDAKEVAAVFSGPFHNFLMMRDEPRGEDDSSLPGDPNDWYDGSWTNWNTTWWRSTSDCYEYNFPSYYPLTHLTNPPLLSPFCGPSVTKILGQCTISSFR